MDDLRPALLVKIIKLFIKNKPKVNALYNPFSKKDELHEFDTVEASKFSKLVESIKPAMQEIETMEYGKILFFGTINKETNDEITSTTKSTDKEDSKISGKPRHPHFPPGEAEWL